MLDDGFESYTDFVIDFAPWINIDLDGLQTYVATDPATWDNAGVAKAFQVFNFSTSNETNATSGTEVRNFDPHTGLKYAACWAGNPASGTATANNDWLVTKPVTLGTTGNTLSLWVKSMSNSYGLEKYKIGVYVGSGTPTTSANFTIISGATNLTAPYPAWENKTFSLDAYAGQTIRVGIQCVSSDVYMFMVDDVKITTAALGTSEVEAKNTKIFPNPSKGEFTIQTNKKVNAVNVYDAVGKLVLSTKSLKFDLASLPKGIYLMNANFSDGTKIERKLIKE